jgi:hypothetical protein
LFTSASRSIRLRTACTRPRRAAIIKALVLRVAGIHLQATGLQQGIEHLERTVLQGERQTDLPLGIARVGIEATLQQRIDGARSSRTTATKKSS